MKPIPCAYIKDPDTGFPTIRPAVDWFAAGLGVAHRKWDGIPYLIEWSDEHASLVAHRGVKLGPNDPVPLQLRRTSDAGHYPITGWLQGDTNNDNLFMDALHTVFAAGRSMPTAGTYELCGPDIKGNPENLKQHALLRHDLISYLRCPRQLDEVVHFMLAGMEPAEGIVWHYQGQYCQLTRADIGLPWPPE